MQSQQGEGQWRAEQLLLPGGDGGGWGRGGYLKQAQPGCPRGWQGQSEGGHGER